MPHHFSREVPTSRKHRARGSRWSASRSHGRALLVRSLAPRIRSARSCHRPRSSISRFIFGRRIARGTLRVYDVRGKTAVNAAARRKGRASKRGARCSPRVLGYWFPRADVDRRAPGKRVARDLHARSLKGYFLRSARFLLGESARSRDGFPPIVAPGRRAFRRRDRREILSFALGDSIPSHRRVSNQYHGRGLSRHEEKRPELIAARSDLSFVPSVPSHFIGIRQ